MPLLFSYGTLQRDDVQRATFGRLLRGRPDELVGFARSTVTVADPAFVAASGKAEHAIVRHTGRPDDRVRGRAHEGGVLLLAVGRAELHAAHPTRGRERVSPVVR